MSWQGSGVVDFHDDGSYTVNDSHVMSVTFQLAKMEFNMPQITARLSDSTVVSLDHAAQTLHRSRADIVRQAIEMYLEDFNDISISIDRLKDPADEIIDWQEARRVLLADD